MAFFINSGRFLNPLDSPIIWPKQPYLGQNSLVSAVILISAEISSFRLKGYQFQMKKLSKIAHFRPPKEGFFWLKKGYFCQNEAVLAEYSVSAGQNTEISLKTETVLAKYSVYYSVGHYFIRI